MASGDLTQSLSKSLDRHLVFPLLEFLMNKELYKESDIQKAKIALLANTNMVDYAMDIYESLYGQGSAPQSMTEQREQVRSTRCTMGGLMRIPAFAKGTMSNHDAWDAA